MSLKSIDEILNDQFQRWERNHEHLPLDWQHYSPDCPPLLFIGGGATLTTESPVVVVSIEPLKASHFLAQVSYAGANCEQFRQWNRGYFEVFPELPDTGIQPYWRNMTSFVAGWAGRPIASVNPKVPWPFLAQHFIELPYTPMHALEQNRTASKGAAEVLQELFIERVSAIVDRWPSATFVVLAASVRDSLKAAHLLSPLTEVKLEESSRALQDFGTYFNVTISSGHLNIGTKPLTFVRNGPLSNWTNPKAAGRYEIGRVLRAIADIRKTNMKL